MARIQNRNDLVVTKQETFLKERKQRGSLQLGLRYPQLSAISLIIFTILVYGELKFIEHMGGILLQLKSLCSGHKPKESTKSLLISDAVKLAFTHMAFPVAGWLADAKYGRRKVINMSVWLMWWGLLIMVVSLLLIVVPSSFFPIHNQHQCNGSLAAKIVLPLSTTSLWISFILIGIGAGGYLPNILPFIIDQLPEASSSLLSSYVRWYSWALCVGHFFGLFPLFLRNGTPPPQVILAIGLFAVHSIVVIANIFCQSLFIQSQGYNDPYKTVLGVVHFACKHKTPIRRSAMTYCESGLPSRLDLAKTKYGGPYTNEAVENVKTFFRILLVLLTLGGYYFGYSGSYIQLHIPTFLEHYYDNPESNRLKPWETAIAFTNPSIGIILLPVIDTIARFASYKFEYLIHKPFLWIGVGFVLMPLCNGSLAIIAGINYLQQPNVTQVNHTCFLKYFDDSNDKFIASAEIPSVFLGLANVIVLTSVLYFICSQAPSSMRGMLVGLFLLGRRCFIALGNFFSFIFVDHPLCSLWFWLLMTIVGSVSVPLYAIIAKRYQKRKRQEIFNYHAMIEAVIERDIRHDEDIEKLLAST